MNVVALIACHDRRELTLRCLRTLFTQTFAADPPSLTATVVDDGSTDGTADAVRAEFESARVIAGDGTLYWARAMQIAEASAISERPDFLLWLNDDVRLAPTTVDRLLATSRSCPDAIIVGALIGDTGTRELTYSGVALSRWHPMRARLVVPSDRAREADTFNGNVVLVPRSVYERVGAIDGGFSHSQADFDYGLRARRAGFPVLVAPGHCGVCPRGDHRGTFLDRTLSLGRRWELMQRPTGLPMRSHARYLRRHGGLAWPLFWMVPYVKLVLTALATAPGRLLATRG